MTKKVAADLLDNLIGMVDDNQDSDYDTALKMGIKALEQEPRKGHWIEEEYWGEPEDDGWGRLVRERKKQFRCSCCRLTEKWISLYCPNCGADLREKK